MNHLPTIALYVKTKRYIDLVDTLFFFTRRSLKSYQTSSRERLRKARATNLLFLVPHRLPFQGPPENLKEHYFRSSNLIFEGYRHLRVGVVRQTWLKTKKIHTQKHHPKQVIIIYLPTFPFWGKCVYCLPGHHKWRDLSLVASIGKVSDDGGSGGWKTRRPSTLVSIRSCKRESLWGKVTRRMRRAGPNKKKTFQTKKERSMRKKWQKRGCCACQTACEVFYLRCFWEHFQGQPWWRLPTTLEDHPG